MGGTFFCQRCSQDWPQRLTHSMAPIRYLLNARVEWWVQLTATPEIYGRNSGNFHKQTKTKQKMYAPRMGVRSTYPQAIRKQKLSFKKGWELVKWVITILLMHLLRSRIIHSSNRKVASVAGPGDKWHRMRLQRKARGEPTCDGVSLNVSSVGVTWCALRFLKGYSECCAEMNWTRESVSQRPLRLLK